MKSISKNHPESQVYVSTLYHDKKSGILFAGSNSQGIFAFKNNQLIHHLTKKNKLSSNLIYAIRKGPDDNSVLVCHNLGLDILRWKNGQYSIQNLNNYIGIKSTRVSDAYILENRLYVASDDGLIAIDWENLKPKQVKPRIKVQGFKVDGKIFPADKKHYFSYHQNDITIDFIGLSYYSQKNITYKYKLNGHDHKWTKTRSDEINYKALSPGNYEFVVFAINSSNIYSKPALISFTIAEPFWQTWPFIFGILTLFLLVIFMLWMKRLKIIRQKFENETNRIATERDKANLEKQMIALEQKVLLMQMNPHFIFNALNTIKGYYSEGNDEKAGAYISKFSKLLRMLLENTEQIIPLSTEIEMLRLYIELTKIRYKNSFEYKIEVDNAIAADEIGIPTLLLQPMVENAIIHGLAPKKQLGELLISFRRKGDMLECMVKDNGIGRKASGEKQKHKLHESKAIEITKERLALLESDSNSQSEFIINDLFNEQNQATGTCVNLVIPYKNLW